MENKKNNKNMESLNYLYKPIPILFNSMVPSLAAAAGTSFVSFAGTDINLDSKVYLLYDMPTCFLARRFNDVNKLHEKFKIMVIKN